MIRQFDFDETKTAEENIEAFLVHAESINKPFGTLLRQHLEKMVPLPEPSKRSTARASFNNEIKKQLDAALATPKAKHA